MALLALPIMTFAQGEAKGYRNATGSVCSDGSSCNKGCCAQPSSGSCCCPNLCGHWSLEGAALYWKVCFDDELLGFGDTFFDTVRPGNEWGFKVKGQWSSCDWKKFVSLTYWYFDESDHGRTPIIESTDGLGQNEYFFAKLHHEYQRLSARAGHYCCYDPCKGGLYAYGGISWIYIKDRSRFDANQLPLQRGQYQAAGFEAGVGARYKICGGFGLAAELGGVAAIGDRKSQIEVGFTTITTYRRPQVTLCVPGLDTKLEAFYECCWCGFDWGLFVGYEQHYFWNVKKNSPLLNPTPLAARNQDFGVGGLYFGARVGI